MPYTPEPHVWEKLKWIFAGAQGMQAIDWFDFLLHGSPWLIFVFSLVKKLIKT